MRKTNRLSIPSFRSGLPVQRFGRRAPFAYRVRPTFTLLDAALLGLALGAVAELLIVVLL